MRHFLNIIISVFLFAAGSLLAFRAGYFKSGSLTAVNIGHKTSQLNHFKPGLLLKGGNVSGSFTALTDRLGGLSFRFDNQDRMSTDSIIFRIKEEGNTSWYYENQYRVDQFQPKELFPFGFPIISNSRNKKYIFEIESESGTQDNAIAVSSISPVFKSKYQFTRSTLFKPVVLVEFLYLKIISITTDVQFLLILLTYLIPFLIFVAYLFTKKNHRNFLPPLLMIMAIILHLLFQTKVGFLVPQIMIFSWIETVILYKISSFLGAVIVCFFTLLTAIFASLNQYQLSQNTSGWVFVFLGITVIQGIIELHLKPPKKLLFKMGALTLQIH